MSPMSPDGETTPAFSCVVRLPSTSSPIELSSSPVEPDVPQQPDVPRRDRYEIGSGGTGTRNLGYRYPQHHGEHSGPDILKSPGHKKIGKSNKIFVFVKIEIVGNEKLHGYLKILK